MCNRARLVIRMPRACTDALTIVLYLLGQWSEYTGHPESHLLKTVFTHSQLQDASPGWEKGFTQHPISPMSLWWTLLLSAAGLVYTMLNLASWWFMTFRESSPVQSSPVQSSPVQSSPVQSIPVISDTQN